MQIRELELHDAANFVDLLKQIEEESKFMLFESGERKLSTDQQEKNIEIFKQQPNSTIIVAEENEMLVGYIAATGGEANRNAHIASLTLGIRKTFQNQGIGTALIGALEEWAREHHIHRLELTVAIQHEKALSLYDKVGFEIEGTKNIHCELAVCLLMSTICLNCSTKKKETTFKDAVSFLTSSINLVPPR